eukprot:2872915-Rhodomonas_salina.1
MAKNSSCLLLSDHASTKEKYIRKGARAQMHRRHAANEGKTEGEKDCDLGRCRSGGDAREPQ